MGLQNVNKSHCPMKNKLYLMGLFHRIGALIFLNCCLIFVIDGSIPSIKLATYRRWLNSGTEVLNQFLGKIFFHAFELLLGQATQDGANSLKLSSLKRNMGSEFSWMIKEAKYLGSAFGIPYIFIFGARTVYTDILPW
ncbi:hypothetical protein F3Y22_tig00111427pilonHSYRG00369 [Hibiscus syriacus]|uniref:Uncharacterized protein n=1 Tax=Hibiscus syriacus TaxID=106335 RepID=A0A6A2Y8K0_HIBSY|nr:hypothetical protein F3Y22_tig00111427pilonHSYRG00369 [Hibiscus syriacus]